MRNIERALDHAHGAALSSNGVGGRNGSYRIGAAIFNKRRVLITKHNSYKTHPTLLRYTAYPHLHAEQAAVLSYGIDHCYGHEMCVVRVRRDGSLAMAKPCPACYALLRDSGIVAVHFTTDRGTVDTLEL